MPSTFEKLQLKDHPTILVLNAPASFESELATRAGTEILRAFRPSTQIDFALAFVTTHAEIESLAPALIARATPDPILWFAYPKGTSKLFKSEVSRDRSWQSLLALGFDTVRSIAIDADWTALRFRRLAYIKR